MPTQNNTGLARPNPGQTREGLTNQRRKKREIRAMEYQSLISRVNPAAPPPQQQAASPPKAAASCRTPQCRRHPDCGSPAAASRRVGVSPTSSPNAALLPLLIRQPCCRLRLSTPLPSSRSPSKIKNQHSSIINPRARTPILYSQKTPNTPLQPTPPNSPFDQAVPLCNLRLIGCSTSSSPSMMAMR
jgi:hypothetical protein